MTNVVSIKTWKILKSFKTQRTSMDDANTTSLPFMVLFILGIHYFVFLICFLIFTENRREPLQVARFQTAYFPNLDSKIGCLHIEYNVQGMNTFMFVVSQRTKTTSPRIISSNLVAHSSHWKRSKIDVQLCQQESQFIVEVLCQWCTRGSMFSISRISFAWESCQS